MYGSCSPVPQPAHTIPLRSLDTRTPNCHTRESAPCSREPARDDAANASDGHNIKEGLRVAIYGIYPRCLVYLHVMASGLWQLHFKQHPPRLRVCDHLVAENEECVTGDSTSLARFDVLGPLGGRLLDCLLQTTRQQHLATLLHELTCVLEQGVQDQRNASTLGACVRTHVLTCLNDTYLGPTGKTARLDIRAVEALLSTLSLWLNIAQKPSKTWSLGPKTLLKTALKGLQKMVFGPKSLNR